MEATPQSPATVPEVAPEVTPVAVENNSTEDNSAPTHFDAPTDAAPTSDAAPTGERKKYDDVNKIYVENIPNESTDEEVREYFARCGEVVDFALRRGKTFKFAFIGFSNEADFKDALELNGKEFNGAALTVEVRKPRGERPPRENRNNNNNNSNNNSRFNRDRAPMAGQRRGREDSRDRYPRRDDDRRDLRRRDDDRRPPMGGADERKCFRCGQLGHIAMKCPTGTVCFTCNGVGHRSTECPTRLNGGGGRGRSPPRRRSPPRDYRRDRSPPRDHYRRERSPPRDNYRRRSYTPPRDYRRRSYSPARDNIRDNRDNNYSPRRSPSQ